MVEHDCSISFHAIMLCDAIRCDATRRARETGVQGEGSDDEMREAGECECQRDDKAWLAGEDRGCTGVCLSSLPLPILSRLSSAPLATTLCCCPPPLFSPLPSLISLSSPSLLLLPFLCDRIALQRALRKGEGSPSLWRQKMVNIVFLLGTA